MSRFSGLHSCMPVFRRLKGPIVSEKEAPQNQLCRHSEITLSHLDVECTPSYNVQQQMALRKQHRTTQRYTPTRHQSRTKKNDGYY